MNPIPVTWCAAGALALSALGFAGGWTVHGWQRDSAALTRQAKAARQIAAQSAQSARQAQAYEKERQDADVLRQTSQTRIRTVYRDRVVADGCALDDAAGRVLDDAITAANGRAAGQSPAALPADQPAPRPVQGP